MAGSEMFVCPSCSEECNTSFHTLGMADIAYCDNCEYQYTRDREHLVDDVHEGIKLVESREKREAYEEYDCEHFDDSHPYTKPTEEYTKPDPQLRSHENISFTCFCGDIIGMNNIPLDESVECGKCNRSYKLVLLVDPDIR